MTRDPLTADDRRRRELELYAESSRLVASTLDLSEVLDRLAGIARIRLEVDVVRIWLVDEESDTIVLRAQTGTIAQGQQGAPRFRMDEGLAGWVISHAEPVALAEAENDPRVRNREMFRAEGIHSFLAVPIMLDMSPIGLLACLSRTRREFSEADTALAAAVAAPAAVAVRNARLYAEALGRLEEIQAFQRVTSETLSSPGLETVLRTLVQETRHLLQADAAFCSLIDPAAMEIGAVVALEVKTDHFVRYRVTPGEGLVGLIVVEKRPVRSDDYLGDRRFSRSSMIDRWARDEGIRTMIAAPVLDPEGGILAMLWAFNRTATPFTLLHEERLVRLTQQAALAIGKARSFEEERRRAAETAALLRIARASTSTLELRPLLRELAIPTAQALGAERCTIYLAEGDRLAPVMSQFADGRSDPALWAKFKALMHEGSLVGLPAGLQASRTKQPVVVEDTESSELVPRGWVEAFGTRSLLVVPLISKDRVIGSLSLDETRGPRRWTPAQVDLAMTIAAQVALAVDIARQYAEAQQRAAEVETLSAIGETLTSTLDLQGVLEAIADSAKSLIGAQRALVFELEPSTGLLRVRAVRGISIEPGRSLRIGQGAAGIAALKRGAVWSADVQADPLPGQNEIQHETGIMLSETAQRYGYHGVLAVPVLSRETVLGAVCIYWDEVHAANEREIRLLSALARQAAIAMENARLVSDLRRTLSDLKAAQETLVRGATLRAVGELAAGAAHHLNNLMAVVLGRTQLLLMRDVPPPMVQSLKTIERAAVDAADTVRRIQAFGRTDRDPQAAGVDLNGLIQEALQLTRSRWENEAQAKGIRIQVVFEPVPLPKIPGRSSEIREVVANLILNAVDALPSGGSIVIRTSQEGSRATVSVKDNGAGMPEEVSRRVFEPFFTTKGVKSTGLGLAVAYGTIRRHGGEIAVESAPDQGTQVTFWLPVSQEAAVEAVAATPEPAAERRGSVLVIDDEAPVRELVADVLSAKGHTVAVAVGGREGLARFAAGRFDVVLTDLGMPDMTGWEVTKAIKASHPSVPVLLITGWGDLVEPPEGARVDGVVTKPFDVTRLAAAVMQALRTAPPRSPAS
jgi:GAF domain-containing protein/ActR/RegA family two-component response regulator